MVGCILFNRSAECWAATREFGSLINGTVTGSGEPIPFSNFGTDIHVPAGTCLGYLEEAPKMSKHRQEGCEVFLNLTNILKEKSLGTNAAGGAHPASYPDLVRPTPEDMYIATEDHIDAFLNLTEIFEGMSKAETNEPEGTHPEVTRTWLYLCPKTYRLQ
jgi:hypothetical protein